jgi:hypothetical protein
MSWSHNRHKLRAKINDRVFKQCQVGLKLLRASNTPDYFVLCSNPSRSLKSKGKVTIVIVGCVGYCKGLTFNEGIGQVAWLLSLLAKSATDPPPCG